MVAIGRPVGSHRVTPAANTRYGMLWTGQSYVLGEQGQPAISTSQPYSCVRGVDASSPHGAQTPGLVPLVAVGSGSANESMLEGSMNQFARLNTWMRNGICHHRAIGGSTMAQVGVGSGPYSNQLGQIDNVVTAASPDSVVYLGINVHNGYSDETGNVQRANNTPATSWDTYFSGLQGMQRALATELAARTGQTWAPPLFIPCLSFWQVGAVGVSLRGVYTFEMSRVGLTMGDVYCVGPAYQYALGGDRVHLTSAGYRAHAEHWGCVWHLVFSEGFDWKPLHPIGATISGNRVTVTYFVPSLAFGTAGSGNPLVLDTGSYAWRGDIASGTTHGYVYQPNVGPARSITSVSFGVVNGVHASIHIDLDGAPEVGGSIDYAAEGQSPEAGSGLGPTGNLRDNQVMDTESGGEVFNWCINSSVVIG